MTETTASPDLIDSLVPLADGSPLYAVRHQRNKVVDATQGSYNALFDPALPGLTLAERLLAACRIAQLAGTVGLFDHYREQLATLGALSSAQQAALDGKEPAGDARLAEILRFTTTLAERPVEGDRPAWW